MVPYNMSQQRTPTNLAALTEIVNGYRRRTQATQLEVALLRQRLLEMQAQSKTIQTRLQTLQRIQARDTTKLRRLGIMKRRAAQRKQATNLLESRRTAQRQARTNQRRSKFETEVLNTLQLVEKDRDWKQIKRSINAKKVRRQ